MIVLDLLPQIFWEFAIGGAELDGVDYSLLERGHPRRRKLRRRPRSLAQLADPALGHLRPD